MLCLVCASCHTVGQSMFQPRLRSRFRLRSLILARPRGSRLLLFPGREVFNRGSVQHFPEGIESRSVASAIPALLGGIPADDALEMRAGGRVVVKRAALVSIHSHAMRAFP